jgi:hypothetical protein
MPACRQSLQSLMMPVVPGVSVVFTSFPRYLFLFLRCFEFASKSGSVSKQFTQNGLRKEAGARVYGTCCLLAYGAGPGWKWAGLGLGNLGSGYKYSLSDAFVGVLGTDGGIRDGLAFGVCGCTRMISPMKRLGWLMKLMTMMGSGCLAEHGWVGIDCL